MSCRVASSSADNVGSCRAEVVIRCVRVVANECAGATRRADEFRTRPSASPALRDRLRRRSMLQPKLAHDLVAGVADRAMDELLETSREPRRQDVEALKDANDGSVLRALCAVFDLDRDTESAHRYGHRMHPDRKSV